MIGENEALEGGQCGWRSQAGERIAHDEAAPSCTAGEEFGFDSKDDGKPRKVLGSRMTRFNLNNPTSSWAENTL